MRNYLVEAIYKLRSGSEFVIRDNDYSTVEWHVLEGDAPTQNQIDVEILKIQAQEKADETSKAAAKADLLSRLNITDDEVKLLFS